MIKFRPTLEHVVIATLAVAGMIAVAAPINDNSMFVHMRTGMEIVKNWSIPSTDPYSFTANGREWIVQSWLAEAIYGLINRFLDDRFVIILHMLIAGATGLMIALLARANTMLRTLGAGVPPLAIAWISWSQRPLLFGLLAFALLVFVAIRRRSAWWLLPIAWAWVNTHGSWPIGIAWLIAFGIGERFDRGDFDKRTLNYLGYFVGGVLLGAINPVGPKILLFFTTAFGDRAKSFAAIVEWGSPGFHSVAGVCLAISIVLVIVAGFRTIVPWRHTIPVAGLLVAALYSSRNLAPLAVAVAPLMGHALSVEKRPLEQTAHDVKVATYAFCLVVFVGAMLVLRTIAENPYETKEYPVAALERMNKQGLLGAEHNVLSRETASCYRIWRVGKEARVFMDDRIDMYPASISQDYLHLFRGDAEPQPILDKHKIDVVLWDDDLPLTQVLKSDPRWKLEFTEKESAVFTRR